MTSNASRSSILGFFLLFVFGSHAAVAGEPPLTGSPELECGVWTPLAPTGTAPGARSAPAVIFDPDSDRMIMFSGSPSFFEDTWALSMGAPAWSQISATGPMGRWNAAAILDPVRHRMIVHGGSGITSCSYSPPDTWALSLSGSPSWSQISATGSPATGRGSAAIYDPVRDRMIVFGGASGCFGSESLSNSVWALNLSGTPAWTQILPSGTPPTPRALMASAYDPVGDRLVIAGGWLGGYPPFETVVSANDAWALSLSGTPQWTQLAPSGTPPTLPRWAACGAYDPAQHRLLVFGGYDGGQSLGDLYALSLGGSPAWLSVATTGGPSWSDATLMHDPGRGRFLLFGPTSMAYVIRPNGFGLTVTVNPPGTGSVAQDPTDLCLVPGTPVTLTATPVTDYIFLGWSGDVSGTTNPLMFSIGGDRNIVANFAPYLGVEDPPTVDLGLELSPNPTTGRTQLEFVLPREGRAYVSMHDLSGREVARLVDGMQSAGRHIVAWNPLVESAPPANGVYFARIAFAGRVLSRKLVLMR